jgi:hypothetical protein
MARFERAATRPPDVYSNLAELHPGYRFVFGGAKISKFAFAPTLKLKKTEKNQLLKGLGYYLYD